MGLIQVSEILQFTQMDDGWHENDTSTPRFQPVVYHS